MRDLMSLVNEDYQNRGDNSPRSGIPVMVDVVQRKNDWQIFLAFKNTSEAIAKSFAKSYADERNLVILSIESRQTGDYHDDWVDVTITVPH